MDHLQMKRATIIRPKQPTLGYTRTFISEVPLGMWAMSTGIRVMLSCFVSIPINMSTNEPQSTAPGFELQTWRPTKSSSLPVGKNLQFCLYRILIMRFSVAQFIYALNILMSVKTNCCFLFAVSLVCYRHSDVLLIAENSAEHGHLVEEKLCKHIEQTPDVFNGSNL